MRVRIRWYVGVTFIRGSVVLCVILKRDIMLQVGDIVRFGKIPSSLWPTLYAKGRQGEMVVYFFVSCEELGEPVLAEVMDVSSTGEVVSLGFRTTPTNPPFIVEGVWKGVDLILVSSSGSFTHQRDLCFLLKGFEGQELWSPAYGGLLLKKVDDVRGVLKCVTCSPTGDDTVVFFSRDGRILGYPEGACCLWPSSRELTWENWMSGF